MGNEIKIMRPLDPAEQFACCKSGCDDVAVMEIEIGWIYNTYGTTVPLCEFHYDNYLAGGDNETGELE